MKERRVVITGMGIISPIGNDIDTFKAGLAEGRCGISLIEVTNTNPLIKMQW